MYAKTRKMVVFRCLQVEKLFQQRCFFSDNEIAAVRDRISNCGIRIMIYLRELDVKKPLVEFDAEWRKSHYFQLDCAHFVTNLKHFFIPLFNPLTCMSIVLRLSNCLVVAVRYVLKGSIYDGWVKSSDARILQHDIFDYLPSCTDQRIFKKLCIGSFSLPYCFVSCTHGRNVKICGHLACSGKLQLCQFDGWKIKYGRDLMLLCDTESTHPEDVLNIKEKKNNSFFKTQSLLFPVDMGSKYNMVKTD
jgi:hypothetical protein